MKVLPNANRKNLSDEEFYSRTKEIGRLKSLLNTTEYGNPADLLITGQIGIGKTVLLKIIKKELEEDYLVVYIDCSHTESFQKCKLNVLTLMEHFYKCIIRECENKEINTYKTLVKDFFKRYGIEINNSVLHELTYNIDHNAFIEFVLDLPDRIYEDNKDKIKGVILLIDEFQIIKELDKYKEGFLWLIRSYMQEQNYVS